MITLARTQISTEQALEHLRHYADTYSATVTYYDYAGDTTRPPSPADGVQMADIARLVVINARLSAGDIPALLERASDELWQAVPHGTSFTDLPDNPLADERYQALVRLYDAYSDRKGLGPTKTTKMLHLKRPHLVPILDSVAESVYLAAAEALAAEFGQGQQLYWAAIWREVRQNQTEFELLAEQLQGEGGNRELVGALPLLRLHDILVWDHFHSRV